MTSHPLWKCPNCGAELRTEDADMECPKCGAVLVAASLLTTDDERVVDFDDELTYEVLDDTDDFEADDLVD